MKKVLIAVLIVVAVSVELLAGSPIWHAGYVILPDGRKLEGELSYNWKVDVLQVRMANGLLKAYSAGYADSFVFYDQSQQVSRKFSSVDLAGPDHFQRAVFMEEVVTGSLLVYRRLRHTHELIKITRPSIYSNDSELVKDVDNFDYLVFNPAGQVIDMAMFNADLWPLMAPHHDQLSSYIKSREVDPSTTLARLLIINQYNNLIADQGNAVVTGSDE